MLKSKILPTITTLDSPGSTWQDKIGELDELGLEEVSLFLTGLDENKRKDLYQSLERTGVKKIPHVHLRTDMRSRELKYLESLYKVEVFNTHPTKDYPLIYSWDEYFRKIFVENTRSLPDRKELCFFGGVCLDFAHWENALLNDHSNYKGLADILKDFSVGCAHLSAVKESPEKDDQGVPSYDFHTFDDLSEFDYLRKYLDYFPKIASLELNNSLKEQLKVKEYIEFNIL